MLLSCEVSYVIPFIILKYYRYNFFLNALGIACYNALNVAPAKECGSLLNLA